MDTNIPRLFRKTYRSVFSPEVMAPNGFTSTDVFGAGLAEHFTLVSVRIANNAMPKSTSANGLIFFISRVPSTFAGCVRDQ